MIALSFLFSQERFVLFKYILTETWNQDMLVQKYEEHIGIDNTDPPAQIVNVCLPNFPKECRVQFLTIVVLHQIGREKDSYHIMSSYVCPT